jgi:hypothetical protein
MAELRTKWNAGQVLLELSAITAASVKHDEQRLMAVAVK